LGAVVDEQRGGYEGAGFSPPPLARALRLREKLALNEEAFHLVLAV